MRSGEEGVLREPFLLSAAWTAQHVPNHRHLVLDKREGSTARDAVTTFTQQAMVLEVLQDHVVASRDDRCELEYVHDDGCSMNERASRTSFLYRARSHVKQIPGSEQNGQGKRRHDA